MTTGVRWQSRWKFTVNVMESYRHLLHGVTATPSLSGHGTHDPDHQRRIRALPFRSNVRNLLPGDFPVFGHAVHHPRRRGQDHQTVLETHPPRLFRADPARIRRGIDGGDTLLA